MPSSNDDQFAIIAVGASAGNRIALKEFFSEIPREIQACFVVVLHLSQDAISEMPQVISQFTPLTVVRASNECQLERGTVFVMPENVTMQVKDRVLLLHQRDTSRKNFAIDEFFSTLANDFGSVNLGVILSGMGSDGTQGALDLYRSGGSVLVQDPASTNYKGMPESAIEKDHPEVVGTPRELGICVTSMVNDIYLNS